MLFYEYWQKSINEQTRRRKGQPLEIWCQEMGSLAVFLYISKNTAITTINPRVQGMSGSKFIFLRISLMRILFCLYPSSTQLYLLITHKSKPGGRGNCVISPCNILTSVHHIDLEFNMSKACPSSPSSKLPPISKRIFKIYPYSALSSVW